MATPEDRKYEPVPGIDFKQDRTRPRRLSKARAPLEKTLLTIYLLSADEAKLRTFCDEYLNSLDFPDGIHFKPFGPFVYLIVMRDGEQQDPYEVAFSVPVTWYENEGRKEVSKDWVLVSPFVFSQLDVDAIVDRELHGRPTVDAKLTLESGEKKGEVAGQSVLSLETQVLPDLDKGEQARDKVLMQILNTQEKQIVDKKQTVTEKIFTHGIKSIMLKQFRDTDEPTRACYQALVRFRWKILKQSEIVTQTSAIIRIADYANFPIVQTLGLIPPEKGGSKDGEGHSRKGTGLHPQGSLATERDEEGHSRKVAELRPLWSLSMEVDIEQETGTTICWRAGTGDWKREDIEEKYHDNKKLPSPMEHPEVRKIMQTQN